MMGYGFGYHMMGGMFGMMFIPLILIIILVFVFFRQGHYHNHSNFNNRDNSLNILNERFARGEINEEEYKHKKDLLTKR